MDWKLELVAVPVSDVDRAKAFYADQVGFTADHDHRVSEEIRFVQLTPPGSACSIAMGLGVTDMPPGSVRGLQIVVPDLDAACAELKGRGVEVGEIQPLPGGRFAFFAGPDGNGWALQEVTTRLQGSRLYKVSQRLASAAGSASMTLRRWARAACSAASGSWARIASMMARCSGRDTEDRPGYIARRN